MNDSHLTAFAQDVLDYIESALYKNMNSETASIVVQDIADYMNSKISELEGQL